MSRARLWWPRRSLDTICSLDDDRLLHLLLVDGEQMRMRLFELLVARDVYESNQGFSPGPYTLFSQTFGLRLPPDAIREAEKRRWGALAHWQN